eukprot:COSAG02_NODE_277_length_25939_cov_108.963971_6_plen_51_part_00
MLASLAQEQWPCFVRFGATPCYRLLSEPVAAPPRSRFSILIATLHRKRVP